MSDSARARGRRDLRLAVLATVLLSTMWILPHLAHLRGVPDRGDPIFSAWRIARFAHQLAHDPAHLFDGNIFYPRHWTLAYSDATILEATIGAPFVWAGFDPLIVANLLFLIAFPLRGLAFFWAAWRLTDQPIAAAAGGVAGAWYPFFADHYSHLELQWIMFVPVAIVLALDVARQPTRRRAILLATALSLQCLASMYLGLMLVAVSVPLLAVAVALDRTVAVRRRATALLWVTAILVPVALLIRIPYDRAKADHGERGVDEIRTGSAVLADYTKTSHRLPAYSWHGRESNRPERVLFPGASPMVLAATGVVAAPAAIGLPLAAGAVAAFDWSLGLNGVTYTWLLRLTPFKSIRVPARFSALLGAILALLAAFGAKRILSLVDGKRRLLVGAIMLAVIVLDLRVRTVLVDYYPSVPFIYQRVGPAAVLAEFPAGHEVDYMYFSTRHWAALLSGYSGFMPGDPDLERATGDFPAPESLATLRAKGATHLTYNCAFERSAHRCEHNLAELGRSNRLELVASEQWQGAALRLYRFR